MNSVTGLKGLLCAAAAVVVTAGSASAQVVADQVRVVQNTLDALSLAEVQAFSGGLGGTNWALSSNGSTAFQTSECCGGAPGRAIDGNTDGVYGNGSVSHTAGNVVGDYWQATFAADQSIDTVRLFGRSASDCCETRDNNITVQLFRDGAEVFSLNTGIPDNDQEITLVVPEPASLSLLAVGGLGLLARRRRRA